MSVRIFYGWWIVVACLLMAVVGWSLGTFGMGVYILVLTEQRGFSVSAVSTAATLGYLVSAACLITVGTMTARLGPKPVVTTGAVLVGLAVAALAFCEQIWQVFAIFIILGAGRSCLSPTAISTTLAPWFERHQGRAVSLALLGASIGGMIGTPLLLGGMAVFSSQTVFLIAGTSALIILLPVVIFVLKTRPQDIGLLPDGEVQVEGAPAKAVALWTKRGAMATRHFQTQTAAFALALLVQSGFLAHHVPMAAPIMGAYGASIAVSSAAVAAFIGRILLARFADRVDLRLTSGAVFVIAGFSLGAMSLTDTPTGLLITSICYGLTIGNITSLSPIIARREFGAAAFGYVYGVAASVIAVASALGPALYGILRDVVGNYSPALLVAGLLNFVAAAIIVWGGRRPMSAPA